VLGCSTLNNYIRTSLFSYLIIIVFLGIFEPSLKEKENDRGIFRVSVLRYILMRLIYNDKYPEIDSKISARADGGPRSPPAHAWPFFRPPIDTSGNFPAHVSAESPSSTSPNPSKVISEVLEPLDNFSKYPPFPPKNRIVRGVPEFFFWLES
jgi:hypothetical protein